MKTTDPYFLFGCGGHGRSMAELILLREPDANLIFIDPMAQPGETVMEIPVLPHVDLPASWRALVSIGDNEKRRHMFLNLDPSQLPPVTAPQAHLARNSRIGRGSCAAHGVYLGPEAAIGDNTILNTGSIVEHEVCIGDHCHIAPHATICGRTKIEDRVMIGAGATVIDQLHITSCVIIGAGAAVVQDVIESGIYAGVPARRIADYPPLTDSENRPTH